MHLEEIQLSLNRILEYTNGMDFKIFETDHKTLHAVLMYFTIIGEAAKNLPEFVKEKYPDVPWKNMYALRNRVSHAYFAIRYEQLWEIIKINLPENKKQIDYILQIERKTQ